MLVRQRQSSTFEYRLTQEAINLRKQARRSVCRVVYKPADHPSGEVGIDLRLDRAWTRRWPRKLDRSSSRKRRVLPRRHAAITDFFVVVEPVLGVILFIVDLGDVSCRGQSRVTSSNPLILEPGRMSIHGMLLPPAESIGFRWNGMVMTSHSAAPTSRVVQTGRFAVTNPVP